METGLQEVMASYAVQHTQRLLSLPPAGSGGNDGGALWLPHNVAVQLEMVKKSGSAVAKEGHGSNGSSNGNGTADRRDLQLSVWWAPKPDVLLGVSRVYGADGALVEASCSTGIKA
jgi:hypothetical protein